MLHRIMGSVRWAFNFRGWTPSQSEWMFCSQCIQHEEKDRVGKFVFKKDAKSAMVGRMLIRKVVSEYLDIPYKDIKLARTDKGKPYLVNLESCDFNFNVSHQGDYAILAAEPKHVVGVDIMKIESRNVEEFFHTMRRQFTPEEWNIIKSPLSDREKLKMFFRHWCLKESYVKALGIGIGFEIRRLNFTIPSRSLPEGQVITDTSVKVDSVMEHDWTFEEQMIDAHCVAVAVNHSNTKKCSTDVSYCPCTERFRLLTYKELVSSAEPLTEPDLQYWQNFSVKPEDPSQMRTKKDV